jgi:hypothetical protein
VIEGARSVASDMDTALDAPYKSPTIVRCLTVKESPTFGVSSNSY